MENTTCTPKLLLERVAQWLLAKCREYRIPILASFLTGTFSYMFAFTNKLINQDEVISLFTKGTTTSSGRWGLDLLSLLLPDFSMPWFHGFFTILLMTAAICLIISIFSVQNKLLQALLSGSVIAFPSLIGTFSYMFTSSSYAVSFFLSVLSVYFIQKQGKRYIIPALLCLVLSLSIYQAYIAVAASFLVLILIYQALYEEKIPSILLRGVFFVFFLVASLGLYYGITQLILLYHNTEFNTYAASNISFSLTSIPSGIFKAYHNFLLFFIKYRYGLIPTAFSRAIHCLCVVASAMLFLVWGFSQKRPRVARFLLLFALTAILPLAINCMYLFTDASAIHTLVLYSFIAVYILAVIIADACYPLLTNGKLQKLCRSFALNTVTLGIAAVIFCNILVANEAYLKLHLQYENAYAFYTTLVADLKRMPDFIEDTEVAIIGEYQTPAFYRDHFSNSSRITGIYGFWPDSYSKDFFLEYYLGVSIPFASASEVQDITNSPEYAEMAVYPYSGSIKMIDDTLVVKLS